MCNCSSFLKRFCSLCYLIHENISQLLQYFSYKKEYAKQNHLKIRQLKLPTEEEKEKITNVNIFSRSMCTLHLILSPLDVSKNKIRYSVLCKKRLLWEFCRKKYSEFEVASV